MDRRSLKSSFVICAYITQTATYERTSKSKIEALRVPACWQPLRCRSYMWALDSEQRHSIRDTASVGLLLSVVFFFAISAVLGSIAALVFYKPLRESEDTK
jgi:hypothetical protein